MKKSELTAFIKEEILASLTSEDTQQDIKDTEELTAAIEKLKKAKEEAGLAEEYSEFKNYDDIVGGIHVRLGALEDYIQEKQPDAMDDLQRIIAMFNTFDEDMTYYSGNEMNEEEDAPAGDKEIEKKASKQDIIIKNYQKLQRDLKRHLKAYKEAKSEEEKQSHLKDMKKISQSAEYLDAKAKYEKLKKV